MDLNEKLNQMASDLWSLVRKSASVCQNEELVVFHDRSKEFTSSYVEQYKNILENYMKHKKESLDRHKVAAIVIIAVIKAKVLTPQKSSDKFTGNYALAVDAALNYMLDEVNEILKQEDQQQLEGYVFPTATTCNTEYYKIFYRNLYYIDTNPDWRLNPLDIADRLFLLEYITLLEKGIDPKSIKWQ